MKWILVILGIVLVLGAAAAFGIFGYWLPYENACSTMPESGTMILRQQENGRLQLTWPEGKNQDRYLVQILQQAEPAQTQATDETEPAQPNVLYETYVSQGTKCDLPFFPLDQELTLRVSSARAYRFPFEKVDRLRMGEHAMEVTGVFQPPAVKDLTWTPDVATQSVRVQFSLDDGTTCRMYYVEEDGQQTLLDTLTKGDVTIAFGEKEAFQVPQFDRPHTYAFDAYREAPGLLYYGGVTEQFSVYREDMLGTELQLTCEDKGNNVFCFTWNETKGEHYEIQRYNTKTKEWDTVYQVPRDGERTYTTGHLPRYAEYRYRVVALGGQTLPDSEFAATESEVQVSAGLTPVYCTVWPIQDLEVYSAADKTEVIGTAPGATAYCVLDMVEGLFYVRFGSTYGYIDSNYCMINLPEFLGDICMYDIANSYESLYMAHEYEIPTVTGELIIGYEDVRLYNNDYLVPLLYPSAVKLEKAAKDAISKGYKIKIYDAYRPRKATEALYKQAINLSDKPIPDVTFSGEPVEEMPTLKPGEVLTYFNLMTDYGRYTMNYFLAAGKSRHNMGVAMDMTLYNIRKREDVKMQTSMHDLSWYSELKRNNADSKRLASIMQNAGFTGLTSEWWHFQDNDAINNLGLKNYLFDGVSPKCWMKDDNGWRYRRANGKYYTNCTRTIDGVEYIFDANGYVTNGSF